MDALFDFWDEKRALEVPHTCLVAYLFAPSLIWVSPVAGGPGGTKKRNENWHRAAILGSDQSASPAAGDDAGKASAGCGGG